MATRFEKLTRKEQRKLATGGKITERGITFERLRNGDGRYAINVMVDGTRVHRVVGRESDGTTRTQAEEYLAKIRSDAKNSRLSLPKGRKLGMSFAEAADRYLDRLESEGGKDLRAKRRRLRLHLVPFFRATSLGRITSFEIERYKKRRLEQKPVKSRVGGKTTYKERGTSGATVNRELAVLSHLFNKAVEWGWIEHSPARIRRLREQTGRIVYLTAEQAARVVECARADSNPQVYPFVVIGLGTSMRLSEILSIRREHVDLQRRTIFIPQAKAGARDQPISEQLSEFLAGYLNGLPDGCAWLFPSEAARCGHTVNIRKPFRRVVEAAGLNPDEIVRHTLRHTAITQLVQAGVDLPTVKRISGHKTLAMVERYAHANGDHIREAMSKLDRRYGKAEGQHV